MITDNSSNGAASYFWNFGDGTSSTEENPVHVYSNYKNQQVQLIAFNADCADTVSVNLADSGFTVLNSVPNIITPNGDNVNDCFSIMKGEKLSACFNLQIFNRWGSKVYETGNKYECWNGKSDGDKPLPDGTYFYIISINDVVRNGIVQITR